MFWLEHLKAAGCGNIFKECVGNHAVVDVPFGLDGVGLIKMDTNDCCNCRRRGICGAGSGWTVTRDMVVAVDV